jgi:hypothetical protein
MNATKSSGGGEAATPFPPSRRPVMNPDKAISAAPQGVSQPPSPSARRRTAAALSSGWRRLPDWARWLLRVAALEGIKRGLAHLVRELL